MAIIKNKDDNEEIKFSTSKKVGRASSRDLRKKTNEQKRNNAFRASDTGGVLAQMKDDGTMLAPVEKKKKKSKNIFSMIKKAKKENKK